MADPAKNNSISVYGSWARTAFRDCKKHFVLESIAQLRRRLLFRKLRPVLKGRRLVSARLRHHIFEIRYHSYCRGNSDSIFGHNIRASSLSFLVSVGKQTELPGFTRAILGIRNQQIWRNTYIFDVKGWINVSACLKFLIRSGVGSPLQRSFQALVFARRHLFSNSSVLICSASPAFSIRVRMTFSSASCSVIYGSLRLEDRCFRSVARTPTVEEATCTSRENSAKGNISERELGRGTLLKIKMLEVLGPAWKLADMPLLRAVSWRPPARPLLCGVPLCLCRGEPVMVRSWVKRKLKKRYITGIWDSCIWLFIKRSVGGQSWRGHLIVDTRVFFDRYVNDWENGCTV